MRFVIQVVKEASVKVDRETIGQIGKGYVVLIEFPTAIQRLSLIR